MAATPLTSSPPPEHEYMVVLRPSGLPAADETGAVAMPSWDAFMAARLTPLGFFVDGWTPQEQADLAEAYREIDTTPQPVAEAPAPQPPATPDYLYAQALKGKDADRYLALIQKLGLRKSAHDHEKRLMPQVAQAFLSFFNPKAHEFRS